MPQNLYKIILLQENRHYFLYRDHSVKVQGNQIYQFSCMHIIVDATYYIKLCHYTSIAFNTIAQSSFVNLSMF